MGQAVIGQAVTGCRVRGRRLAGQWSRPLAWTAAIVALVGATARAAEPTGIWYDHTGRGAVEISSCGSALCGRVVWLKDAGNRSACGLCRSLSCRSKDPWLAIPLSGHY